MLPVIDQFTTELSKRLASYELPCSRFGFLSRPESCSYEEIHNSAKNLVAIYGYDLDESLGYDLVQFSYFVKMFKDETCSAGLSISQEHFM